MPATSQSCANLPSAAVTGMARSYENYGAAATTPRPDQTISANTTPTATMAAMVANRALGRVLIMCAVETCRESGLRKWLPGTGSNRRPSD